MKAVAVFMLVLPVMLVSCATTTTECPVCQTKIVEKPVVLKCEPPEVPRAELEIIKQEDSYEERLRKLIKNYGLLKEENILLRRAMEVCK
ncbi:hypothetical protein [Pampinifervens florentissimum]|uniref:hypothetical protein n=1 Tax=Pampinifervens florentissimum TaxID=1632019 RepID=UPI0013B49BD0|nr:hypothetical protein [Hydrogenobacter sp. T-8]QID32288.1 hypothetical protein G3M65_00240 [Hydrogenobacter sp. T-8]